MTTHIPRRCRRAASFLAPLLLAVGALCARPASAQDIAPGRTSLRPEEVDRVATRRLGKVKRCYREAVKRAPSTWGTIGVGMNIAPDGAVGERWIAISTVADPTLERCVLEAFAGLRFPAPGGYGAIARVGMQLRTETSPAAALATQEEAYKRALRGVDAASPPPPARGGDESFPR